MKNSLSAMRRRVLAKIHGFPDRDGLIAQGLKLGSNTYLGRGSVIDWHFAYLISIGNNSTLGPQVTIIAHDASTKRLLGYTRIAEVRIGDDVFIGGGSIILPGVSIGNRSIIGAGSVVRRDVDEGTVVTGNPAKFMCKTDEFIGGHSEKLAGWLEVTGAGGIAPDELDHKKLGSTLVNFLQKRNGYIL